MESDLESEKELVTLSPVKDIQESIKKVRTSSSEVIFKDLLALTDRPEETKVPNTELRKPDSPPVEWSNEDTPGGVSHFQAKPVDDIETFVSISPNRISDSMSGLGFSSEDKLVDKAPEPPVVLKPAVKRQKKAVVISVMRKTRKEEPHEVGTGALQRDRAKQDRNIRIDHNSTTFDRSPVVQFDEPTDSPSAEKLGLIKRTGDKSRSPPEMGFLRTKIPSVIYREDAWFTYKDENGILTYIALEKATRRYRKRLSFLSVLMLLVSIISVLSFAAVGFRLYAAWDLWFLMLFPLGLSLGVLFVLFIVRFSLRPHRIVSLMKHYYRVDVLAFTESSAVIYDHHDSVSDYSFHYSIFPFDEIRSELSVINKASVSIHDEENAISSLAKCADLWNSKMKEFHEVPVATRNSFLYRCVESLLPYSIIISHDDTMRTVREMTLPARWDEGKSLSMNPLFVQFCGLRGILDDFNSLIKRIDESISLHEERLRANITATKRYYSEFSRLTSKMTGMSGITFNDDNRLEIPLGENDPGPVTPLESIIRKFGDETRGKREWIAEEYDGKTKDLQEAMEAEIENERNELGGKSSEIDFQIRELELETEGLQKEIRHIERSMEERGPEISETSDKDGTNREKERLELECVRILDKLERNEKMLALLTKRATELDNDLDAKILKIEKVYKEKKGPIESEKKMELADVEKELNVLKGLRDEIIKIAIGSRDVFSKMEEREILPFMERLENIQKIRNYLVTAIENDKNELTHGIKPTDDLKFKCEQTLPLSFHFPFWSIQLSTGETSVILPMLMNEDGETVRKITDMCASSQKLFRKFYPSQAEFEDFLAKRVRADEDFFPSKKLMAAPDDMKKYSGILFTDRFLKMVKKRRRYLW